MNLASPDFPPANRKLGQEVAAFAERCAAFGPPGDDLPEIRHYWQSRYLLEATPLDVAGQVVAKSPGWLATPGLFLSLTDREAAVALRVVSAIAGIVYERILTGLSDTDFTVLTSAISRFQNAALQIQRIDRFTWETRAQRLIKSQRPPWVLIDGIGFGCGFRTSQFDRAASLIEIAATHECQLLLFD